jgi:Na+/H+ antiporter NhaA
MVRVEVGDYVFAEDLQHLVNDLLKGLFFVVGMEIKRELVNGGLAAIAGWAVFTWVGRDHTE